MNKNKIVRQYKWMRILRFFAKTSAVLLSVVVFCVIMAIFIFLGILLSEKGFALAGTILSMIPVISTVCYAYYDEYRNEKQKSDLSVFSNFFTRHFEKKWGMTENEIKDYISRRKSLGDKPNLYVLPYVSRLCRLNGEGRQAQETFLSDWFSEDEIALAFSADYTDSQFEELSRRWKKESLSCRKSLMELLFKLAIVQDGIHNDEWNMLMSLMTQLKFNKNYFDFFKNRYSSLRTEFDDYEYKRSASTEDHSVSYLKPYFELLGLDENATDEEIKRAYHNLALLHHPDLPKNSARIEECETLMTKINEAYEKVRR